MKILLVEPPFERLMGFYRDYFPISLAYLAAALEAAGHEVLIYDAEHSPDTTYLSYLERAKRYDLFLCALENDSHPVWHEAIDLMAGFQPEIIGFSVMTVKFSAALKLASLAKKALPESKVVFGGPHPTIMPEQVIEQDTVDFVVRGEGEETMIELCEACAGRRQFESIAGLTWRDDYQTIINNDRELIQDISKIAHPARHLLWRTKTYTESDLGLMMTSRGCPFQCTYCSSQCMWKRKVRYRDVADVVDEIEQAINRYNVRYITFEDDSFTVNRKRIFEFCEELKRRRLKIRWSIITRIDLLDDEVLDMIKRSGCDHVRVGIESGSDKVLKSIKKGITTDDVRNGARLLKEHGMYWSAYFMIGLPAETADDIRQTVALMREVRPSYSTLSVFTPYPGTQAFDEVVAAGLASLDMDWSRSSHHSPYNYYTPNISKEQFEGLLAEAEAAFDRQNKRLSSLAAKLRSRTGLYFRDPKQIFSDAGKFLSWIGIAKIRDRD